MDMPIMFLLTGMFMVGIVAGIFIGIAKFNRRPPSGKLIIRYLEPEEEPYIFLELWEVADDLTTLDTVNLVVSVVAKEIETYTRN